MDFQKVNRKLTKQSQREFAYFGRIAQQYFSGLGSSDKVELAAGRSSNCSAANSLYRYPSPDRPAYSPSRSITEIRLNKDNLTRDIGYHAEIAIDRGVVRTNCGAADITTIGLRLCKRHQSSLQQWQYLVWQVALITTQSAAWLAQALVWLPLKCWAQIAQAQCLLAQLSACFATTQVYALAAKVNNRAHLGRAMNKDRRPGYSRAAVFSFLGT